MKNIRLLITGSKGLIGSRLKVQCLQKGYLIKELDHLYPKDTTEYGDLLDPVNVEKTVKDVHGIVHLAAVSRVIWGEKNPKLCWKTNVEGTKNIIKAALRSPHQPWILYASSREVYGCAKEFPVIETCAVKPINIYGHSKAKAEELVMDARQQGLVTGIVRFSNVFGSVFDHHDRVVPAFCRAAIQKKTLIIEGQENTFDFTYIDDVVDGTLRMIEKLDQGISLDPIHFTTQKATNLDQLANVIEKRLDQKLEIKIGKQRSFDVSYFVGNYNRAHSILGWSPQTSLEKGIAQFLHMLKREL
ncbi:MAG: UDP-glucose 4-epimerase [Chlamydiae bacterium]|nr:UDP-glucose 4-epimerase [Chlamydiota bacterium]